MKSVGKARVKNAIFILLAGLALTGCNSILANLGGSGGLLGGLSGDGASYFAEPYRGDNLTVDKNMEDAAKQADSLYALMSAIIAPEFAKDVKLLSNRVSFSFEGYDRQLIRDSADMNYKIAVFDEAAQVYCRVKLNITNGAFCLNHIAAKIQIRRNEWQKSWTPAEMKGMAQGKVYKGATSGSADDDEADAYVRNGGQVQVFIDVSYANLTDSALKGNVIKTYYGNGGMYKEIPLKDGKIHGQFTVYRENGKIFITLTYQNGKLIQGTCNMTNGSNVPLSKAEIENWDNGLSVECD